MPLPWLERAGVWRWQLLATLTLAVVAIALTVAISQCGPTITASAEESPQFHESIVPPAPGELSDAAAATTAPLTCPCWQNALNEPIDYALYGSVGASYFNTDPKTSFGGLYGLDFSLPIYGSLGTMASGYVNHYDGGSQYFGTLGIYQASNYAQNPLQRFGWSVKLDQFTDTGLGSPYFVQSEYDLRYQLTPLTDIGVRYVDPLHGDDVNVSSRFPQSGISSLPLRPVSVVEAYLGIGILPTDRLRFNVGYIDEIESMTYGLSVTQPISDRLAASFNSSYDEKVGSWSGFLGLTVDISPRRGSGVMASNKRHNGSDVVRGAASVVVSVLSISDFLDESSGANDETKKQTDQMIKDMNDANRRAIDEMMRQIQARNGGPTYGLCPPGFVPVPLPGGGYSCSPI